MVKVYSFFPVFLPSSFLHLPSFLHRPPSLSPIFIFLPFDSFFARVGFILWAEFGKGGREPTWSASDGAEVVAPTLVGKILSATDMTESTGTGGDESILSAFLLQ
jgi:hypothetical protein